MKHCWDTEDGKSSLLARQGGLHSGACISVATGMMRGRFQTDRQKAQLLQKAGAWREGGHHLKDLLVWILQR